MHARALLPIIREDLAEKMVFLAGPRQVGKTTLARQVLELEGAGAYFSWDNIQHRRAARAGQWPEPPALLVLDELHKQRGWKRWLKGEYDAHVGEYRYLVTGSARLDVSRRGGDSLQGRYHHHRLHPFSVRELAGLLPGAEPGQPLALGTGAGSAKESTTQLLERGGFPEPFLSGSERSRRRWRKERSERFVREDVRELEAVRDLANIELLVDMLPERVGSPLSVNSLCRDLEVSHRAVSNWLEILSRLYFSFRLPPYTHRAIRGLKKEQKTYLWDWSLVSDPGPRLENMLASHLLKLCHHLEDVEGRAAKLHYLRDRNGRELDFLVTVDKKPWFAVEAKTTETAIGSPLRYFRDRLHIPHVYQCVLHGTRTYVQDGVTVVPAYRFLEAVA